jgi:hypothetical protein
VSVLIRMLPCLANPAVCRALTTYALHRGSFEKVRGKLPEAGGKLREGVGRA